jgi:hypothetical protein
VTQFPDQHAGKLFLSAKLASGLLCSASLPYLATKLQSREVGFSLKRGSRCSVHHQCAPYFIAMNNDEELDEDERLEGISPRPCQIHKDFPSYRCHCSFSHCGIQICSTFAQLGACMVSFILPLLWWQICYHRLHRPNHPCHLRGPAHFPKRTAPPPLIVISTRV